MVRNYFKVALRNILKYKFFSFVNILGLTMGISACLFVVMYIYDELNYDHMHVKGGRIYRMNLHGKLAGQEVYTTNTSFPMSKALVAEIPEVEEATRVNDMGEWIFRSGDIAFNEEGVMAADSNFFSVFSFKLLSGNAETALKNPNSIVLTEELAIKYFGKESALDKTLSIGNDKSEYMVTGIMEKPPSNSHLKFNALLSTSTFPWMNRNSWLGNSLWTYYVLSETGSADDVDRKLDPIMERNVTPNMLEFIGKSLEEFRKEGGIYRYYSMPLYDIHLKSDLQDEPEPPGDMSYVFILAAIGSFIILIACINFMNLTTAKSAGRAKEVGLRKALGSLRSTLVGQFLTESMIYAVTAAILAFLVVYTLLPFFNVLSGKQLVIDILAQPAILGVFLSLVLVVGLLAGSYPAFYLTGFKVTEVLKGRLRAGVKSGGMRSFLVTFQFWISIVLIICTAIVYQQLQYVQSKNLGIDKEHILIVEDVDRLQKNRMVFKNGLESNASIVSTSFSNNMIPGVNNTTIFRAAGIEREHIMATYFADQDHMQTLGFALKEGRFFSRDFPSDSNAVVLNQSAVEELGWENPLVERLIDFNGDTPREMEVIGVVEDFNFESLKMDVRPLVLKLTKEGNSLYARFSGQDTDQVIMTIQQAWDNLIPGEPLQYSFLDDDFDALFRAEQRLGKVFTVFTVLAIFIACLGLFGLSAFTAEQRTKEIGIRKAMGASVYNLTTMLSREFTRLVLIAFVLSVYPAYYIMKNWLAEFAYRIEIGFVVFLGGGFIALAIAWLTVGYQSVKAARTNPVRALRYE